MTTKLITQAYDFFFLNDYDKGTRRRNDLGNRSAWEALYFAKNELLGNEARFLHINKGEALG